MDFFSEALNRLKHELRVSKDSEAAEWLGLSRTAFSERKRRGSFPTNELIARAGQVPNPPNVSFVLTGEAKTAPHVAAPDAAYLVGKIPAKLRALRELHGLPVVCSVGEVSATQWAAFESGNGGGYPPGFLARLTQGFRLDPQSFLLDMSDEAATLSPLEAELLSAYRASDEQDQELIRRVAQRCAAITRKEPP